MIGQPVWMMEEKAKERGKRLAEGAGGRDVQIARDIARQVVVSAARRNQQFLGSVTTSMDEVRTLLCERFPDIVIGNWAGSVFRKSEWEPVGWVQSTHKGGHRRAIRTWRLK